MSKDIALALIGRHGNLAAAGHAVEFRGTAIEALSVEARMTLCNMGIELGARMAMIAPDETTIGYLRGYAQAADRGGSGAVAACCAPMTEPPSTRG